MRKLAPYFSTTSLFGVSAIDAYTAIYTPLVILLAFISLLAIQFFGTPISCATYNSTQDLVDKHNLVIEFCSRDAAQFVDTERNLPTVGDYQWIPLILLLFFVCFLLPHFVWLMSRTLIFPFSSAMHILMAARGLPREKTNHLMVENLQQLLRMRNDFRIKDKMTAPISSLYIVFKLLVLVCMTVAHLFVIGALAMDPSQLMNSDRHTTGLGIFAKLATCYFPYEKSGTRYSCVLKFNTICEKVFIILFFWLTTMQILGILSIIYWIFMLSNSHRREADMGEWFKLGEPSVCQFSNQKRYDRFIKLLGSDTWLLLTLASQRGGVFVAAQAISVLWKSFVKMENESRYGFGAQERSTTSLWSRQEELPIVTGVLADAIRDSDSPDSENATNLTTEIQQEILKQVNGELKIAWTNESMELPLAHVYHCHLMRRAQVRLPDLLIHIPYGMIGENEFCNPVIYGDMQLTAQINYAQNSTENLYAVEVNSRCGRAYYEAQKLDAIADLLYRMILLVENCRETAYQLTPFETIGTEKIQIGQRKILIKADRKLSSFPPNEWLVYVLQLFISAFNIVQVAVLNMDLLDEWSNAGFRRINLQNMEESLSQASSSSSDLEQESINKKKAEKPSIQR
ncbi:unnamed protein product, partial [Mesorhabditis belari]|uniref:Innexin n=1 Tax=Mesorhabditis belari TaxID=2138241 RepID=A0AAF3EZB3_9BILA